MTLATRAPLSAPQPQQPVLNNYRTSSQISRLNVSEFKGHPGLNTQVEGIEDDAESAFYRDLQRQEEERQRRLEARRRIG